jgi:hypothetical protein
MGVRERVGNPEHDVASVGPAGYYWGGAAVGVWRLLALDGHEPRPYSVARPAEALEAIGENTGRC